MGEYEVVFTSRESVADSKKSSGKIWRQIDEAAEVAARDSAVQKHSDAQQADRVGHVASELSRGKREHLQHE